jgi:hypothetical protein
MHDRHAVARSRDVLPDFTPRFKLDVMGSSGRHSRTGYYTKSPLFVLGLILLAILFIWPPSQNFTRSRILFGGMVFLIVTAPWVALISERVGHPSISETARLNYEWQVNRMPLYTGGLEESTILTAYLNTRPVY